MKAWRVEIDNDPDQGTLVVFANTRNEARDQTGDLIYDRWIDIRATRFKQMDDKEHLSEVDLMLELWRDHGWRWLDIEYPDPDEASDQEFVKWYLGIYGDKDGR